MRDPIARLAASAALVASLALPGTADAAMKVNGKPKISFSAEGNPGALDIEGLSNQIAAKDDGTTLTFEVPLDSVTTGIDLRDEHMKKTYAETPKFPLVSLSVPKAAITWPQALGEEKKGTITADFNTHGVSKPVNVTYMLKKSKTGWRVQAKFEFDVAQHGIAIPSYLGVSVDPKMKADVTFDLIDAP